MAARALDLQVQRRLVGAVEHARRQAARPVQSAEPAGDLELARLCPGGVVDAVGCELAGRALDVDRALPDDDRLEEPARRLGVEHLVDIAQVEPVLVVPDPIHARVVVAGEPPEPVAALADEDLAPGGGELLVAVGMGAGVLVEPVPGLGQEIPRHRVLGAADPGVEAAVDPASGEETVERAPLGHLVEKVGDGCADNVGAGVELGVERIQEVVPVARVELPGVLAVERDGDEELALALLLLDPPEAAHEVADRVLRRHPVVVEADQVAEDLVPEDHRDLATFALDPVGLVERLRRHHPALAVPRQSAVKRAGEDVLVGDDPLQPGLHRERRDALADRHLGRPHADRPPTQQPLEGGEPERDLLLGVLPVGEVPVRQLDSGRGGAGGVDVADEGQDGVVVGRRRQFDLARLGHLAVLRDHAPQHLQLGGEEDALVGLGELAVLCLQGREAGVAVDPGGVAPGEVGPDLEVADVFCREGVRLRGPRRQLEVARGLLDPERRRRLPEPADQEGALLGAQLFGRPAGEVQEKVGRLAPAVLVDLGQQRGDEVEGLTHPRVGVEQRHHLVVVLDRMQPHPGQEVRVGEVVLVVGLMHVPHQRQANRLHA